MATGSVTGAYFTSVADYKIARDSYGFPDANKQVQLDVTIDPNASVYLLEIEGVLFSGSTTPDQVLKFTLYGRYLVDQQYLTLMFSGQQAEIYNHFGAQWGYTQGSITVTESQTKLFNVNVFLVAKPSVDASFSSSVLSIYVNGNDATLEWDAGSANLVATGFQSNTNNALTQRLTVLETSSASQSDSIQYTIAVDSSQSASIASLLTATAYTTSFTNASLSGSILTVTHSLGDQYPIIQVYDNSNELVIPWRVTAESTTQASISFSGFGILTGTYRVKVKK
jgi:hypothetical protein